jgi:hypothetical protein
MVQPAVAAPGIPAALRSCVAKGDDADPGSAMTASRFNANATGVEKPMLR